MVDAAVQMGLPNVDKLRQRNEAPVPCRDLDSGKSVKPSPFSERQAKHDGYILFLLRSMQQTRLHPLEGKLEGLVDVSRTDAVKCRLFFVHLQVESALILLHIPVRIHNPWSLLKNSKHLLGNLALSIIVRPVYLRHKRGQDRRARRHFRHLDTGTVPPCDALKGGAHSLCDLVALGLTAVFVYQIHLDVGHVCAPPQIIMPHQTVKIKW